MAKSYAAENYYYANKLMLYHYAILFGLCLFEIIVMFLAMNVGFGVRQTAGNVRVDLLLYALAVVISLAFPIAAAILNYLQPDRRKALRFQPQKLADIPLFAHHHPAGTHLSHQRLLRHEDDFGRGLCPQPGDSHGHVVQLHIQHAHLQSAVHE